MVVHTHIHAWVSEVVVPTCSFTRTGRCTQKDKKNTKKQNLGRNETQARASYLIVPQVPKSGIPKRRALHFGPGQLLHLFHKLDDNVAQQQWLILMNHVDQSLGVEANALDEAVVRHNTQHAFEIPEQRAGVAQQTRFD